MKKLIFLILFIATSLGVTAYWFIRLREPTTELDQYTLVPAEYGRVADVVTATGLVQARDVFQVGTELGGKVVEVLADFNQVVKEGDVLLRLDDRMARQKLRQAEVAVDIHGHRDRRPLGRCPERCGQPGVGENRRVDAAGELSELVQRLL